MNIILTTFFTTDKDPQRPLVWGSDDITLVKDFYESLIKHDLNCIILHDNSPEEFINKLTTDKIKWVRVNSSGLNMVDIRWTLYHQLIESMPLVKKVFCLDISDVIILKNPFELMDPDKVYCGDEECLNKDNFWMMERFNWMKHPEVTDHMHEYVNNKVLNCGIVGGNRENMLEITNKMGTVLKESNIQNTTVDMAAINAILYRYYNNKLVHGHPLNTKYRGGAFPFRGQDNGKDTAWIQHK